MTSKNTEFMCKGGINVNKIGIELEIPVTNNDYFAAQFDDLENLFNTLIFQGWNGKFDETTGSLIGTKRNNSKGIEVVETDLGICTLEIALAPVHSLREAVDYWQKFKSETILPLANSLNIKLLGYGNQPRSSNLKALVANKGHYQIYNWMFSNSIREWFFHNFPGLASVQFNFEIPAEKSIKILNTFFALSPVIWAASNNDSIANELSLPYKSQRFFAYSKIAGTNLTDRYGIPRSNFRSLCEYINRMWNLPIFQIIRNTKPLRPVDQSLTINQFLLLESATFLDLDNNISVEKIILDDLKLGIYLSWLDFRLKFNFCEHIDLYDLSRIVHSDNDSSLIQILNYILLEVRPISMQNHEQEIDWMIFTYLIVENIDAVAEYISSWNFDEVYNATFGAQIMGLKQILKDKTLGEIGLDLLELIADSPPEWSKKYLIRIHSQFSKFYSPGDVVLKIFRKHGLQAALEYITMK
jgi:hypothetical protein